MEVKELRPGTGLDLSLIDQDLRKLRVSAQQNQRWLIGRMGPVNLQDGPVNGLRIAVMQCEATGLSCFCVLTVQEPV